MDLLDELIEEIKESPTKDNGWGTGSSGATAEAPTYVPAAVYKPTHRKKNEEDEFDDFLN